MANTTAISVQLKLDALTALLPANITTLKAALYFASATINQTTTAYTTTGEATGSGYTAGGVAVTAANAPVLSGTTACWTPSASITFPSATIAAFDTIMIYDTARANKVIAVWNIGTQSITGTSFVATMPANDAANALVRS